MGQTSYILLLLILMVGGSPKCQSWGWFSSSENSELSDRFSEGNENFNGVVAKFSMDVLDNQKGTKLIEKAQSKLAGSNSCWQVAYRNLFSSCSNILADEEKQSRFAWHLGDCFQKDCGRPSFPFCDAKSSMVKCLQKLDDHENRVYLEFYLETKSICYQLQNHAFKHETERLVNSLKESAQIAEEKLDIIEEKTNDLLKNSNQVYDSLSTIDERTKFVAKSTKNVGDHLDVILKNSGQVYEKSLEIAASQSELKNGQIHMGEALKKGVEMLHDSYNSLGQEIDTLKNEAFEIEKEIIKVGNSMSLKMENLQNKANDIGNIAGISLDKQKQLLDGQHTALEGLEFLTKFQSNALEESRNTLQHLADYSRKQQEELMNRQEQLQQVHDHLVENSKSILAAQEEFELKQAGMFVALDKLFALHNAMLLESRIIKAFFVYSMSIFVIYMFTSTKQTYNVRPILYVGLCGTFLIEVAILRFTSYDIDHQTWIINIVRSIFLFLASIQLLHAIYTYRDFEKLTYKLLLTMDEKLSEMQRYKELLLDDDDVHWSSWIASDLPDDNPDDPDFLIPEQIAENSITTNSITTKKYDLRRRSTR